MTSALEACRMVVEWWDGFERRRQNLGIRPVISMPAFVTKAREALRDAEWEKPTVGVDPAVPGADQSTLTFVARFTPADVERIGLDGVIKEVQNQAELSIRDTVQNNPMASMIRSAAKVHGGIEDGQREP